MRPWAEFIHNQLIHQSATNHIKKQDGYFYILYITMKMKSIYRDFYNYIVNTALISGLSPYTINP